VLLSVVTSDLLTDLAVNRHYIITRAAKQSASAEALPIAYQDMLDGVLVTAESEQQITMYRTPGICCKQWHVDFLKKY